MPEMRARKWKSKKEKIDFYPRNASWWWWWKKAELITIIYDVISCCALPQEKWANKLEFHLVCRVMAEGGRGGGADVVWEAVFLLPSFIIIVIVFTVFLAFHLNGCALCVFVSSKTLSCGLRDEIFNFAIYIKSVLGSVHKLAEWFVRDWRRESLKFFMK